MLIIQFYLNLSVVLGLYYMCCTRVSQGPGKKKLFMWQTLRCIMNTPLNLGCREDLEYIVCTYNVVLVHFTYSL